MVEHLSTELAGLDVQLYLARVLHRVGAMLERSGFLAQLGSEHIWHSISQCVQAAGSGANTAAAAHEEDEVEVIADDTDVRSSRDLGCSGDRRDNAIGLYLRAIRDGQPHAAASAYTGTYLTQHSSGVRDGAAGFVEFFEPFIERNPVRYIRIVRSIEDGRHVFLHAFQILNQGESEWVTTNFFDTDADDRVIGH